MLERVSHYIAYGKEIILQKLAGKSSSLSSSDLCAISITPDIVSVAHLKNIAGKPILQSCETRAYSDETIFTNELSALVNTHQLQDMPCTLVLQPDDYQLLLTDALPVTTNEFQAAIRWKIKDLVRFPINEAIIDHYTLPKMKNAQNKIMVIAAPNKKLITINQRLEQIGLHLKYIDIQELALRNITLLYGKENETIGLIYLQENFVQLLFVANKEIYVSRFLKVSTPKDNEQIVLQNLDRLANEVQRSYDFFQNLWDLPLPSHFIFSSTQAIPATGIELLSQKIRVPIEKNKYI